MKTASFEFFTTPFIVGTWAMSNAELGRQFTDIAKAAQSGDVEFLSRFDFIGRYYKGYTSKNRKAIPRLVRLEVLAIGKCALCPSVERLEVDHIIPVAMGGGNERENLQPLCFPCNRKKGARV